MVAVLRLGQQEGWFRGTGFWVGAVVVFVVLLALTFFGGQEKEAEAQPTAPVEFDAFAGGYPVPPMGDQVLPEFASVLSGTDDDPDGRSGPGEPGSGEDEGPPGDRSRVEYLGEEA
jgi:NADH-quinone oxidoreductase subunit H